LLKILEQSQFGLGREPRRRRAAASPLATLSVGESLLLGLDRKIANHRIKLTEDTVLAELHTLSGLRLAQRLLDALHGAADVAVVPDVDDAAKSGQGLVQFLDPVG